jgi:hypothetical protein
MSDGTARVFMVWEHNTPHPEDWPFFDATFRSVHATREGAEAWVADHPSDFPRVILEEALAP